MPSFRALPVLLALAHAAAAAAQNEVVNVYSARHYQTDDALYASFTRETGIRVNRIAGNEDELLDRIRTEGASSPADVFITADAARLGEADALGIFAPTRSKVLEERVPAKLRTGTWFSFSTRARVIVYDKASIAPQQVRDYEDLASPGLKGKVCVRSGSHPYNLSLGSALLVYLGKERTEEWARKLVANFARAPAGGDTDQIRAVAAGKCGVALANSYYLVRLMRSDREQDREVVRRVGVIWPNQANRGAHVNVSGAGVLKTAPHRDAAIRFLEYLASDEAQAHFAGDNNEWPVVETAAATNPALDALGTFKADRLHVGTLSRNTALARQIFERAGWR